MQNETIVDRVVARLQSQPLGDLITEEDLHDIVKEAIPKVFFAERDVVVGTGYHQEKRKAPPLIFDAMKELLRESAKAAVAEWMVTNADKVAEHWKTILDASITEYVRKAQEEQVSSHVRDMLRGFFDEINKQRQSAGLSPIYI
jgi:hypothetical protein